MYPEARLALLSARERLERSLSLLLIPPPPLPSARLPLLVVIDRY